jgi:hypothetical protein
MSYFGNHEAPVDDLINDPIARLLIGRDGSTAEAVRALIEDARRKWVSDTARTTSSSET